VFNFQFSISFIYDDSIAHENTNKILNRIEYNKTGILWSMLLLYKLTIEGKMYSLVHQHEIKTSQYR